MADEPQQPKEPKRKARQHPASTRLPAYAADPKTRSLPITTRKAIDHSKRPLHDRFGRDLPPWKPEDDEPPRNKRGKVICGAVCPNSKARYVVDGICHRKPASPNGRCDWHGGRSLVGSSSPRFKHGRYSRDLPSRLQEGFIESLNDPNRLAGDAEMALIQTRISELLRGLDIMASAERWETAKSLMADVLDSIKRQDARTQTQKLRQLDEILRAGSSDYEAWEQIARMSERLRKHRETEMKRIQLAEETVTRAEVLAFLQKVAGVIQEHVEDPHTRTRISNDVARLLGPVTGSVPDPRERD